MKIKPTHLILPLLGAGISAWAVSIEFWDASKTSILTALSVIGAGVLVRLARGLPFTNVDQFEVDEARKISTAIKQSIAALRLLIIVILSAMITLVLSRGLTTAAIASWPDAANLIKAFASGLIGLLLTYIVVRVMAVIQGDVGLVDLQSDFFVRAVERKQAERFGKERSSTPALPASNPPGYGKVIQ